MKNVNVIVLLFPTSMFAFQIIHGEFGQSWFCYILDVIYASRFFLKKPKMPKWLLFVPMVGSIL
jgi:hypothetical protein